MYVFLKICYVHNILTIIWVFKRILALELWSQICTITVLQPFLSDFFLFSKPIKLCNTGSLFYKASAPCKLLQRFFRLNFRIPTCDTESSRQIRPVSASSFLIKYGVKGFFFGLGLDLILGTRGCSIGSRIIEYTIYDFRWSQSA